jgi:hypothetical protein
VGRTSGHIDGYAVIDHEIGKMDPITFMTVISPQGSIRSVEILVYRESQGGEVPRTQISETVREQNSRSPLRLGQDISKYIRSDAVRPSGERRGPEGSRRLETPFMGIRYEKFFPCPAY